MHRPDLHFYSRNPVRVDMFSLLRINHKNLHRKSISIWKEKGKKSIFFFSIKRFFLLLILSNWSSRLHFNDTDRISLCDYEASQCAAACTRVWFMVTDVDVHCDNTEPHKLRTTKNKKNSTLNSLAITISTFIRNKAKTAMFALHAIKPEEMYVCHLVALDSSVGATLNDIAAT